MGLGQLLLEALSLMFIGMLFVGIFLGVLVFLIPLLNRLVPDEPVPEISPRTISQTVSSVSETELIAAISAAIQRYRYTHQNK